jgi:hypothetical protein
MLSDYISPLILYFINASALETEIPMSGITPEFLMIIFDKIIPALIQCIYDLFELPGNQPGKLGCQFCLFESA